MSCDSVRDGVEESRPAATRLELVVCSVERSLAASAGVDALGGHVLVVLAGEWCFGTLLTKNTELLYAYVNKLIYTGAWFRTTYLGSTEPATHHCSSAMGKTCSLRMKLKKGRPGME